MKRKNKAIHLLAGAIMVGFLSGSTVSIPAFAETAAVTESVVPNSVLLNDLQCSPVDIEFSSDINTYRIVVPDGTEKVLVSAQLADPNSIYRVIGNNNLQSGSNTVTVEVEDMDGNKNVYEIQVIVGELNEDETPEETDTQEEETETAAANTAPSDTTREQSMAVISSQADVTPSTSDAASSEQTILDTAKNFLLNQNNFKWILCGIGIVAVLLIILCIVLSVRKAKRRKNLAAQAQSSAKSNSGSSPAIAHDLSWTRGRGYEEDDDDKALSDLLQNLQGGESGDRKSDQKKEVPASASETETESALDTPEQTTDSRQESDDDDDTFEIVDIDKL